MTPTAHMSSTRYPGTSKGSHATTIKSTAREAVRGNLSDALGIDEILIDILSVTQETTRNFHVFQSAFRLRGAQIASLGSSLP